MTPTQFSTDSVTPDLIGAAFDRLAQLSPERPLHPEILITMVRSIGCHDRAMPALLVRIRAAAIVFNDPRWLPWAQVFKSCDADTRRAFDAHLLAVIAELPLNSALRFEPDCFFDTLLIAVEASARG